MTDKLPQSGGSYLRDNKGKLTRAAPEKPVKKPAAKPAKED